MKGLLVVVSACLLTVTVVLVAGSLPARSHLGTTPYTMKFKLYACDGYEVPTLPWTLIGGGVQYADPAHNYYRKDVYYSVPHAGFNVSIFTTESNNHYSGGDLFSPLILSRRRLLLGASGYQTPRTWLLGLA
ncbi:hypothetical protein Pelo_17282 [Pelomyxa schiedti]|nr:hypothetical protein Pelo_17282 [Pelomyxa schiedti]